MSELNDQLFEEILRARERVYAVGEETPLQKLNLFGIPATVYAKREDLGPIRAYKWRGAFNRMAVLTPEQRTRGVVAASAGNHAQGVALAARVMNVRAVIYMPRSTPQVKQNEVRRHGSTHVQVVLLGDSYDAAAHAAHEYACQQEMAFIHPYDDLVTMGGQGTLADEIVMSGFGPFDRVYVPIGGGGLVAAVACWLKRFWPAIKVIGVEGVGQASMRLAIDSAKPTPLEYVDVFCDGTAVRIAGKQTFPLCQELVDDFVTVTNNEVCQAIRRLWDALRVVPEPSGALALAAFLQQWHAGSVRADERSLVIVSGANMDFTQLTQIARQAGIGNHSTRFLRIEMESKRGQVLKYLTNLPPETTLVEVQYGKTVGMQYPVFGISASDADLGDIFAKLGQLGIAYQDVTDDEDVKFRIIPYHAELVCHPLFVQIEFPERPGAFLNFMEEIADIASLCYFNYSYSGERVGRALVGMEFESVDDRDWGRERITRLSGKVIQAAQEVPPTILHRIQQ